MKFEVKSQEYKSDFTIYLTVGMNKINPIEVEKDLNEFKEFLIEKYFKEEPKSKLTIKEWFKEKFNL